MATTKGSHAQIDTHVSVDDVFEHVVKGVRLSVLLALIRELAEGDQSAETRQGPAPAVS